MDAKKSAQVKDLFPNPTPGVQVAEGQDFRNLSQAQREAYFHEREGNWKRRYNKNRSTMMPNETITRG
jgi:hypothetical protein